LQSVYEEFAFEVYHIIDLRFSSSQLQIPHSENNWSLVICYLSLDSLANAAHVIPGALVRTGNSLANAAHVIPGALVRTGNSLANAVHFQHQPSADRKPKCLQS